MDPFMLDILDNDRVVPVPYMAVRHGMDDDRPLYGCSFVLCVSLLVSTAVDPKRPDPVAAAAADVLCVSLPVSTAVDPKHPDLDLVDSMYDSKSPILKL